MPRLSLYHPNKSNDYKFIDRQISEMFQVGGTDVYLHKYIGTETVDSNGNTVAKDITQIQDLMFLENRDRKYDQEIYRIRGMYNVQNIDFNLSQFGLFIDNDTLYMTVHINDFIKYIGRKPISGDVLELPHLRDDFALNDLDVSLPRYYVIEDVGRASEGFSSTWFPHLYRLRLKKITDSQQFADILNQPAVDSMGNVSDSGTTLKDLLSTYNKELGINQGIIDEAFANAPKSGYETGQFYTLAVDATGKTVLNTVDNTDTLDASIASVTAMESTARPVRTGYTGYLVGDGVPQNDYNLFGHGIQFPDAPGLDDFFLRTDFLPNRLFRFNGTRWVKVEDAVRMELNNSDTRQTLKTGFINNTDYLYNQAVAVDYIKLAVGDYAFITNINYTTALYLVMKLDTVELAFTITDEMVTNDGGKVYITLPRLDPLDASTQQSIPYKGTWKISLCNSREPVRQAVSTALGPRAKLKSDL